MIKRNTRRGYTQEDIKKNCHSRGFLSGIYNVYRCKTEEKTLLNKYVEDPRLQASGMTLNLTMTHGFTLIELLVVVLIIGILAAVALPQYNKAVRKTKATEILTAFKAIEKAAQDYYLTHDTYEGITPENMDIQIPMLKYSKYIKSSVSYNADSSTFDLKEITALRSLAAIGIVMPENLSVTLYVTPSKTSVICRTDGNKPSCTQYFHCTDMQWGCGGSVETGCTVEW